MSAIAALCCFCWQTITGNDERSKGVLDVIRHGYLLVYHYEGFKFTIKVEDTLPTDSYEMTQLPCCVGGACSDMTGHDGPWSEELSEKIWNREEPRFSRKKVRHLEGCVWFHGNAIAAGGCACCKL